MTAIAHAQLLYNNKNQTFYAWGENKTAGGMFLINLATGIETKVPALNSAGQGDGQKGRGVFGPDGSFIGVWQQSNPDGSNGVYTCLILPDGTFSTAPFSLRRHSQFSEVDIPMADPDICYNPVAARYYVTAEGFWLGQRSVLMFERTLDPGAYWSAAAPVAATDPQPFAKVAAGTDGLTHVLYRLGSPAQLWDAVVVNAVNGNQWAESVNQLTHYTSWQVPGVQLAPLPNGDMVAVWASPSVSGGPANVGMAKYAEIAPGKKVWAVVSDVYLPLIWQNRLEAVAVAAYGQDIYTGVVSSEAIYLFLNGHPWQTWNVTNCNELSLAVGNGKLAMWTLDTSTRLNHSQVLDIGPVTPPPTPAPETKPVTGTLVIDGVGWQLEGTLTKL